MDLVLLDFSGTLCLETVLFGQRENIEKELSRTGLLALGIDTPEKFWNELVGPTWEEGSTTGKGYAKVLGEKLRALSAAQPRKTRGRDIDRTAADFVEGYFLHSPIDPLWAPLLKRLSGSRNVTLAVATDHYAEATAHISGQFSALEVGGPYLVANSADFGKHKTDRDFWVRFAGVCMEKRFSSVTLVDDFGYNEQADDPYRKSVRAEERKNRILGLLAGVFGAPVRCFPFFLDPVVIREGGEVLRLGYRKLLEDVEDFLFTGLQEE